MPEENKQVRLTQIAGMPVMTQETGRKLGNVKDIVFDPRSGRVDAVTIEYPGFFNTRRRFILASDIQKLGKDAIMVKSGLVMKRPESVRWEERVVKDGVPLIGKTVVTESGDILGSITDVIMDAESGEAARYEVSGGTVRDVQTGRRSFPVPDAMVVGPDAIVVPNSIADALEAQEPGGLTATYRQTAEGAGGAWGEISDWWRRTTGQAGQRGGEWQTRYVTGKIAGRTVMDDRGGVIVNEGDRITQDVVTRAKETGQMNQLSIAAAWAEAKEDFTTAGERLSEMGERADRRTRAAYEDLARRGRETGAEAREKYGTMRNEAGRKRLTREQRDMAAGKVSAVDLMDSRGEMIIREGEIFTPMILDRLEEEGLLDQVRLKPIMGPEREPGVAEVPRIELLVRTDRD